MGYERPNVSKMDGYTPGEQPNSLDVVKLNTNENPYPPAAPIMEALQKDAKTLEVPLNDDWTMPPNFAETMNAAGVNLTFVVNPHAPSGRLMPVAELEKLAQDLKGVLCIDEAYVNFVEPALGHSTVELVKKYDNVVILRSFSKGYSLAGLRCGYGIGSLNLVEPMQDKTKDSYNMNYVSQVVSTAALVHWEESAKTWEKVIQERARVTKELEALGWEVIPSSSNFVLATVPASFNGGAANVYAELKAQEILVRYFAKIERLQDKLRCTIGTPDENSKFLDALKKMK